MQYTRLGNSGLIVSRLALGVMTFGTGSGAEAGVWKTGQREADAILGRALDSGINFFDTADMYAAGESEVMMAKTLGQRRKEVIVSTKVGFRSGDAVTRAGSSFAYLISAVEACLRRLNTDYVDLLSVHKIDPFTPMEETARALEHLVQRGMVRYVGYSNFKAWQSAKLLGIQKQHNYSPLIAAQMYYSLVGRDLEHEIVPFCTDAGIGIVVWSPLAGGFLSGRYTRQDPTGGKGRLTTFDFLPFDKEKGYDLVEQLKKIAERHKSSVAQVSLAWMLTKPFVTSILLGASKMPQLEDNLGALGLVLAQEELETIEKLTAPAPIYPTWFQSATDDKVTRQALEEGILEKPKAA